MKLNIFKNTFLICFTFLLFLHTCTLIQNNNKKDYLVFNENNNITVKEYKDKNENWKINIKYPTTKYDTLNKKIDSVINNYLKDFNSDVKNALEYISQGHTFTLNIDYKIYEYSKYISIVFFTSFYTGGAHPNYLIKTLIFDTKSNQFITINNLIEKNNKIIDKLSNYSRNKLLANPLFKDEIVKKMMLEGTTPSIENFSNLVFTSDGIMIFFERYQIAPYYYGDYHIVIPYQDIDLNI